MTHTQATITAGHGWCYDGDRLAGGTEGTWTVSGSGATQAIDNGDFLALTRSGADASTTHANNLSLSSDVYTKIRFRYKCSNASVKASIVVSFSSGSQTVLAATNNTPLTVGVATLTTSKTVNKVSFYALDADGTVYFDYVLICRCDFSFANVAGGIVAEFPDRAVDLDVWGMGGSVTQLGGTKLAVWHLDCDLTVGTWTRAGLNDHLLAEALLEVWHRSQHEPWQWWNSGLGACKVTMRNLRFTRECSGDGMNWRVSCDLVEKRVSSANCAHETYQSRYQLLDV